MIARLQRVHKRSGRQAGGHCTYAIGLPHEIAEIIPEGTAFVVELTEAGVLFRPTVEATEIPNPLPEWVTT